MTISLKYSNEAWHAEWSTAAGSRTVCHDPDALTAMTRLADELGNNLLLIQHERLAKLSQEAEGMTDKQWAQHMANGKP